MVPEKKVREIDANTCQSEAGDASTLRSPSAQQQRAGSSENLHADFLDAVRHGRNQFPLTKNMSDTHLTPTAHRKHQYYSPTASGRNNGLTHPNHQHPHTDISSSDSSLNTVVQEMAHQRESGGLASLFRWFRRTKAVQLSQQQQERPAGDEVATATAALTSLDHEARSPQTSPDVRRGRLSVTQNGRVLGSNSSVNSTLSTASSFAFLHSPRRQKKMAKCPKASSANSAIGGVPPSAQTDLLLRKKYGLHISSEELTTSNSSVKKTLSAPLNVEVEAQGSNRVSVVSRGSFPSRKKRPAPPPPLSGASSNGGIHRQRSLSPRLSAYVEIRNTQGNPARSEAFVNGMSRRVNSVVSDSGSSASGMVHVRGKRRAPSPPVMNRGLRSRSCVTPSEPAAALTRFTSLQRKNTTDTVAFNDLNKNCPSETKGQWYDRKTNAIEAPVTPQDQTDPARSNVNMPIQNDIYEPSCPRNDILKLERGMLTPVTERIRVPESATNSQNQEHRLTLPLKPWYKRNAALSCVKKELSLSEKPKKKSSRNYEEILVDMPYRRSVFMNTSEKAVPPTSAMNSKDYYSPRPLLRSLESTGDAKKNEVKRRSLLANISELDREAAEIIQRDKERETARKLAVDARFYAQIQTEHPQSDSSSLSAQSNTHVTPPMANAVSSSGTYVKSKSRNTPAMNITAPEAETNVEDRRPAAEGCEAAALPVLLVDKPKKDLDEVFLEDKPAASTKELINMFNSFNVTRVRVNPSYVKEEDHPKNANDTHAPLPAISTANIVMTTPIPAVVSDLNNFIDTTRQDLSSPKVVRKMDNQGVRPKERTPSTLAQPSPELKKPAVAVEPNVAAKPDPKPPSVLSALPSSVTSNLSGDMWSCKVCTLLNKSVRLWCEACSALRPRDCPPPDFHKLIPASSTSASPANSTKLGHENQQATSPTPSMTNNVAKTPLVRSNSQTNWEVEIKKYFPASAALPPKTATVLERAPPPNLKYEKKENERQQTAAKSSLPIINNPSSVPMPSTFLGSSQSANRTKIVDPTAVQPVRIDEKRLSTEVKPIPPDPEEIRKARLAFFQSSQLGKNCSSSTVEDEVFKKHSKNPENLNSNAQFGCFSKAIAQSAFAGSNNGANLGPCQAKSADKHVTKVDIVAREINSTLSHNLSVHHDQESCPVSAVKASSKSLDTFLNTKAILHNNLNASATAVSAPVITRRFDNISNLAKPTKVSSGCQTNLETIRKTSPMGKKAQASSGAQRHSRLGLNLELMEAEDFAAIEAACVSVHEEDKIKHAEKEELAAMTSGRNHSTSGSASGHSSEAKTRSSTPDSSSKLAKGANEGSQPLAMRVLLQALEDAIAAGQFDQAASLSRQLAFLKQQLAGSNNLPKPKPEVLESPVKPTQVAGKSSDVKSPLSLPSAKTSNLKNGPKSKPQSPAPTASMTVVDIKTVSPLENNTLVNGTDVVPIKETRNGETKGLQVPRPEAKARLVDVPKKPEKVTNGSQTQIVTKALVASKNSPLDENKHAAVGKESVPKTTSTPNPLTTSKQQASVQPETPVALPPSRQALAPAFIKETVTPIKKRALCPLIAPAITHPTLTSPELVRKVLVNETQPQVAKPPSPVSPLPPPPDNSFTVQMFIEDKVTHHGPFPVRVKPEMTLLDLKKLVAAEYEVPVNFQRWILQRTLAKDDNATLEASKLEENSNIFLYLVAPELKKKEPVKNAQPEKPATHSSQPTEPVLKRYYNYDEERYSTCSESEEEIVTMKAPAPVMPVGPPQPKLEPSEPKVPPRLASPPLVSQDGWVCISCTLVNPWDRPGCAACTTARPDGIAENLGAIGPDPEVPSPPTEHATGKRGAGTDAEGYNNLLRLDGLDLVPCSEAFQCPVCFMEVPIGIGVTLRECLHAFCKDCLSHAVEFCEEAVVSCPFRDESYACPSHLQEREVKALVSPEVFEKFLARSMALAEKSMKNTFHCQTPDCPGWCIIDDNVNLFRCPACGQPNCLTCQAIHEGLNCKQFQDRVTEDAETDEDAKRTKDMIDALLLSGEALNCPQCQVVLMKRWGCDWVRCSVCRTEICWVTKGARWGPNGKGDVSGGCRCGVNNVKCHPKCNYCH